MTGSERGPPSEALGRGGTVVVVLSWRKKIVIYGVVVGLIVVDAFR